MTTTANERPIDSGRARLCTEAFGGPGDPAILLIMGLMASMLWWPEAFCRRLARAGRFVIRYDNRDTGRSTSYEQGKPGYTMDDLALEDVDWSDLRSVEEFLVRDAEAPSGSRYPFDEAATRAFVEADLARTANPPSLVNHTLLGSDAEIERTVRDIRAPLLVVHGSADPLFPHAHGTALAEAVSGATLVTVEGGGHELHEGDWDQIVEAIVAHTA